MIAFALVCSAKLCPFSFVGFIQSSEYSSSFPIGFIYLIILSVITPFISMISSSKHETISESSRSLMFVFIYKLGILWY